MNKKFKPRIDKLFYLIWLPLAIFMLIMTAMTATYPIALIIMLGVDAFTFYFLFSSLFAYAELRESALFIKFGFIIKKEIPYDMIRGLERERKFYSDSMLSIKNSLDHVNIRYNRFDMVSVSVKDNDKFIAQLEALIDKMN
ncbi:MAG: PH domain-containing protein [Clostridia bacterium]|nr:PH domain-containing protein [Clostridia bacterium]